MYYTIVIFEHCIYKSFSLSRYIRLHSYTARSRRFILDFVKPTALTLYILSRIL